MQDYDVRKQFNEDSYAANQFVGINCTARLRKS